MSTTISTNKKAVDIMQIELHGNGYGEKYKKTILKTQKHFFNWAEERGITDLRIITKKDIYHYQNDLLALVSKQTGKPLARATLSEKYNAIKMLFSVLYRTGILNENITSGIKFDLPKRESLKRQAFSEEEMSEILEKININTVTGLRDRTIFELIYSSGLRVSEVSKLTIRDLCLTRREMLIRGKFARDRIVPFSKMAHSYLSLYLKGRINNKDEPVFYSKRNKNGKQALKSGSISRMFSDLLKKHNMKKRELSTHSIRHSSASQLLNNGASIRHVQELLGHRNPETTARYTHTQGEKLAKIFRKYHPQEHDLFDAVDDDYKRRLESVLGIKGIR
ncbi:MAG: tyrosine-type recombinase/integrase [Treponema sp.]|nr:tyrosine-type recombinase/integrase [Treponema sp.]